MGKVLKDLQSSIHMIGRGGGGGGGEGGEGSEGSGGGGGGRSGGEVGCDGRELAVMVGSWL